MSIVKGKIANALTSAAKNHIVATTDDIYDENFQEYQDVINKRLNDEIDKKQNKLTAGKNIRIENDVISAVGDIYSAGTGITIENDVISVSDDVMSRIDGVEECCSEAHERIDLTNDRIDSIYENDFPQLSERIDVTNGRIDEVVDEIIPGIDDRIDEVVGLVDTTNGRIDYLYENDLPQLSERIDDLSEIKQDKLIAGNDITINGNVISVSDDMTITADKVIDNDNHVFIDGVEYDRQNYINEFVLGQIGNSNTDYNYEWFYYFLDTTGGSLNNITNTDIISTELYADKKDNSGEFDIGAIHAISYNYRYNKSGIKSGTTICTITNTGDGVLQDFDIVIMAGGKQGVTFHLYDEFNNEVATSEEITDNIKYLRVSIKLNDLGTGIYTLKHTGRQLARVYAMAVGKLTIVPKDSIINRLGDVEDCCSEAHDRLDETNERIDVTNERIDETNGRIDEVLVIKQNKLIAGQNITIDSNNVISATGGVSTDEKVRQSTGNINADFPILVSAVQNPNGTAQQALYDTGFKINPYKHSIREGYDTKASGSYSHAEGYSTTASGYYSHAEGLDTEASGTYSHAEGYETTANSYGSHAEGYSTITSREYSHAEGSGTTADGTSSHAEGAHTEASGEYSHAEGSQTRANGEASHAEGGYTTANGIYSHAEGSDTVANGNYSHAEGRNTITSGYASHAEGDGTTASGECSHAEGQSTTAIGLYSHAEGQSTTASGQSSHAEGITTTASGSYSHAEGEGTTASGYVSHAEGYYTEASGRYSHAEGCGGKRINGTFTWTRLTNYAYLNKRGTSYPDHNMYIGMRVVVEGTMWPVYTVINIVGNSIENNDRVIIYFNGDFTNNTSNGHFKHYVGAIGETSHAEGARTEASGSYSHAEGAHTEASGYYSHAEGSQTRATNAAAHAEGVATEASGMYSHAEGARTEASGKYSHAEGSQTRANGEASHAEGTATEASGMYSHTEGRHTEADGDSSHAEGRFTVADGNGSHAEGYGIWCKVRKLSYGTNYVVLRLLDHIKEDSRWYEQRENTEILRDEYDFFTKLGYSMEFQGETDNTIKDVEFSRVDDIYQMTVTFNDRINGYLRLNDYIEIIVNNVAGNNASHAEGKNTFAIGRNTHSEGLMTVSSYDNAHAEGHMTSAHGKNSHAEGLRTIAKGENSHAEGYNEGTFSTEIEVVDFDRAFIVDTIKYVRPGRLGMTEAKLGVADLIYIGNADVSYTGCISSIEKRNNKFYIDCYDLSDEEVEDYDELVGEYIYISSSVASGDYSHTEGKSSSAFGESSHAEGKVTMARGAHAHSEGQSTLAAGHVSHAEGVHTIADGNYSHSEGEETMAVGNSSHSEGRYTKANGQYSHVEGRNTITNNSSEHAEGQYNSSHKLIDTYGSNGNTQHSVGIGTNTADTRNAFEIMQNGDAYLYGLGNYHGNNVKPQDANVKTIQDVINSKQNSLIQGTGISITGNNTISVNIQISVEEVLDVLNGTNN